MDEMTAVDMDLHDSDDDVDVSPQERPRRRRRRSLNDLDVEILRVLTRFGLLRGQHVAGLTGASGHTVAKRLRLLKGSDLVREVLTDVDLVARSASGQRSLVSTITTAYQATGRGARVAGQWTVAGVGSTLGLPAASRSRLLSHHALGVADLAVWYLWHGCKLASEREIRSLERPIETKAARGKRRYAPAGDLFWSVRTAGGGVHPPDLGVVTPDGGVWAVELERATKTVDEYRQLIAAYRGAGIGQVWHIQSQATVQRILEACKLLGITWQDRADDRGVMVSADGLVRLQGWLPARVFSGGGPGGWMRPRGVGSGPVLGDGSPTAIPRQPPAELPLERASVEDITAGWRYGREIDIEDTGRSSGWLVA